MLGLGRLLRTTRFLVNQLRGRVAILLYHRVARHILDPQLLCVTPEHFVQHVEILRRYYNPMSLSGLRIGLQSGRLPRKAVVVTFDDGYADSLLAGLPVLEQNDCHATVFVITGFVGTTAELLHDCLERLLLGCTVLPSKLRLSIAGRDYEWELESNGFDRFPWNVTQADCPTSRHRCYKDLHRLLTHADAPTRNRALSELADAASNALPPRSDRLLLTKDQLRRLGQSALIEIGAHTRWHLFLADHALDVQDSEISASKCYLETILGRKITSFSYPYGGLDAFGAATVAAVRRAGFDTACANVPGLVREGSDPLALPRFLVRDWPADVFGKQMRSFFAA